jgi:acyl carrier protein
MKQLLELLQEIRPDVDFTASADFIEDYLLDSFDIMTLTTELEDMFNIQVPTSEIVPESYQSLETIAELVRRCGGAI